MEDVEGVADVYCPFDAENVKIPVPLVVCVSQTTITVKSLN